MAAAVDDDTDDVVKTNNMKECCICFDEMIGGDEAPQLPCCFQRIHAACLQKTVDSGHAKCPLCRAVVSVPRTTNALSERRTNSERRRFAWQEDDDGQLDDALVAILRATTFADIIQGVGVMRRPRPPEHVGAPTLPPRTMVTNEYGVVVGRITQPPAALAPARSFKRYTYNQTVRRQIESFASSRKRGLRRYAFETPQEQADFVMSAESRGLQTSIQGSYVVVFKP